MRFFLLQDTTVLTRMEEIVDLRDLNPEMHDQYRCTCLRCFVPVLLQHMARDNHGCSIHPIGSHFVPMRWYFSISEPKSIAVISPAIKAEISHGSH